MNDPELCWCGKPLHYSSKEILAMVEKLIRELGPNVPVVCGDKTYLVPRHFIALHGLNGWELPLLGFKTIGIHE